MPLSGELQPIRPAVPLPAPHRNVWPGPAHPFDGRVAGVSVQLAITRTHAGALPGAQARPGGVRLTAGAPGPTRPADPTAAIAGAYSLAESFGIRRGPGEQLLRALLTALAGPPIAAPVSLAGASA